MADFYPLIANTSAGQIQEIPSTANLNLSGCNVINTGTYYGSGAGLTNLPGGNVSGAVANATYATSAGSATTATTAGTVTTAAQPNITSVGTLSSLTVTANITGGNILTAGQLISSIATGTAPMVITSTTKVINLNVEQVDGYHADTANTVSTIAVRDAAANIVANYYTGVGANVTGNITGGNFIGTLNGSGANVTSISATNISSGTLAQARLANSAVTLGSTALTLGSTVTTVAGLTSVTSTTFVGSLSGAATSATTAGTVTTAAQPNITSVGTLSSLTVTANVTGGNLITAGLLSVNSGNVTGTVIVNAGANGVGNIGSATGYFNTAHVKATSAQYADLAEMYVADSDYAPGTVVEFGGSFEITQTSSACSTAVAGIISTNPSYLMNSCQSGEYVLPVALTGRVPCQVLGPVKKGDVLISSGIPGVAQRIGTDWQPGCTVGKAMENISEAVVQTIEVAVGRL